MISKGFNFDAILLEVTKDTIEDIVNIPFDNLGKVGKNVFYCVPENLKSRIEKHSQWQEEKEKENNNNKWKNEKKKKNKR